MDEINKVNQKDEIKKYISNEVMDLLQNSKNIQQAAEEISQKQFLDEL